MIIDEDIIICSECEHKQMTVVCQSVNVTIDQKTCEMIFSGELFLFVHERCHYTLFAGYLIVYDDKKTQGRFLICLELIRPDRREDVDDDMVAWIVRRKISMWLVSDLNVLTNIFIYEVDFDDQVVSLFEMLSLTISLGPDPEQVPVVVLSLINVDEDLGSEKTLCATFWNNKHPDVFELSHSFCQTYAMTRKIYLGCTDNGMCCG
ncbi:MAG: CpXC domain-containing protein [Methanocalculaceae archaeon]|jgi:hypothetical protein|nr:CpXC domain-containing protein [Methanocalculaceae archaeon]